MFIGLLFYLFELKGIECYKILKTTSTEILKEDNFLPSYTYGFLERNSKKLIFDGRWRSIGPKGILTPDREPGHDCTTWKGHKHFIISITNFLNRTKWLLAQNLRADKHFLL